MQYSSLCLGLRQNQMQKWCRRLHVRLYVVLCAPPLYLETWQKDDPCWWGVEIRSAFKLNFYVVFLEKQVINSMYNHVSPCRTWNVANAFRVLIFLCGFGAVWPCRHVRTLGHAADIPSLTQTKSGGKSLSSKNGWSLENILYFCEIKIRRLSDVPPQRGMCWSRALSKCIYLLGTVQIKGRINVVDSNLETMQ